MSESSAARQAKSSDEHDPPFVSIIVPVYNDSEGIRETFQSLLRLEYPETAHEILVVDNGSTDGTRATIQEFSDGCEHVSLLVEDEIQSSYAARNRGIRQARGEILAFVDADMTVPSDWLSRSVEYLQTEGIDYLGCNVELTTAADDTLVGRYDRETGFPVEEYVAEQRYAPTCCLVVHRSVVDDVGPFDPRLVSGGDGEFGNRVAAAGYRLGFARDIVLRHPTRSSFRTLLQKELRVGRGMCQRQQLYPGRYGTPGIPPRPSGIKSTNDMEQAGTPTRDRFAFSVLSSVATAVRAIGYFREFARYISGGGADKATPNEETPRS